MTREAHPTDRRATLVSFTEHGTKTVLALKRGHEELARALFATMRDEDFACFAAGLDVVLVRIREQLSTKGGNR